MPSDQDLKEIFPSTMTLEEMKAKFLPTPVKTPVVFAGTQVQVPPSALAALHLHSLYPPCLGALLCLSSAPYVNAEKHSRLTMPRLKSAERATRMLA